MKEHVIWWGTWIKQTKNKASGGTLRITRVSYDAFFFSLSLFDGARSGDVQARANILTPHSAYARIAIWDGNQCEISFQRHLQNDNWQITLVEGEQCHRFHGVGATFSGTYLHSPEPAVDRGFLDEIDLNELERLCGQYLPRVLTNFSNVERRTFEDGEIYTIFESFVKGLYPSTHTIIALTDSGKVWCAFPDTEAGIVRYFHNYPEAVIPNFFQNFA